MSLAVRGGLAAVAAVAVLGAGSAARAATPQDDIGLVARDLAGLGYLADGGAKPAWTPAVVRAWQAFGHDRCLTVAATGPDPAGIAALRGQVAAVQRKVRAKATGDFREATGWLVAFWQFRHHRHRTGVADAATMRDLKVERVKSCPPPPAPDYRAAVVRTALGQVGTAEQPLGSNCTKYGPCESWCALFASWVWRKAGVNINTAFTGYFYDWGAHRGTAHRTNHGMQPGDVVLYGTGPQNTSTSVHIGVVVKTYSDGRILTVEGNTSNGVHERGPFDPRHARAAGRPGNIYAYVSPVR
jgi:hypothetical protein